MKGGAHVDVCYGMGMPTILLRVEPPLPGGEGYFSVHPNDFQVTRVPCVGELITAGNDKEGRSLDYRVVLVQHSPQNCGPRDAEVFAVRVDVTDTIMEAWKQARKELGLPLDEE